MRRIATLLALFALLAVGTLGAPAAAHADNHSGNSTHTVRPGDTLYGIAWYYGVSAGDLASANGIYNPDWIYVGQHLSIPGAHKPAPSYGSPAPAPHKGHGQGHGSGHVVQAGDTLYSIAWHYGTTITALMSHNGLNNPDYIAIGQRLSIPGSYTPPNKPNHKGCGYYHSVKRGETLSGIAWDSGTTTYALAHANGIGYPYTIYSGQALHVPCDGGSPAPKKHVKKPVRKPAKHRTPARTLERASCLRGSEIFDPLMYEKVSGTLHVIGTADHETFQFYKLEYAMGHNAAAEAFNSINDIYETAVHDSVLGVWYTGNMPDGDYTLRLTVVDEAGQTRTPCDVHIRLDN